MKERENKAVIKIADLSFAYPSRDYVFEKFNFNFFKGERIGLVGLNGSGKTTLFHLIMGLLHPTEGKIDIFGKERKVESDFAEVRERIGLVFQDLKETLETLGLAGFEDRITYNLSYGEKRLVSLATVWAMQPEILLLDEPTIWLDEGTIEKIVQILNRNPRLSYIIISHDKKFLKETTDSIYLMDNGKINRI
jgi:cobalt/nickel transport system ATP-binding protein